MCVVDLLLKEMVTVRESYGPGVLRPTPLLPSWPSATRSYPNFQTVVALAGVYYWCIFIFRNF